MRRSTRAISWKSVVLTCILAVAGPTGLLRAQVDQQPRPRYVFLFIGDGMGFAQVDLAGRAADAEGSALRMTTLPVKGRITTRSANNDVTDSAAAGTALAAGVKTNNGMLGMTPDEAPVDSVAAGLVEAGWTVGILSSVQANHATPAAFYAHAKSRSMYNEIAGQFGPSGIHLLAGRGINSPDKSQEQLIEAWRAEGITVARSFDDAVAATAGTRLVLLAGTIGKPDAPAGNLADTVALALERFKQSERFFIMAEGGAIDWAGHDNNAWENTRESLAFDRAIDTAYRFYEAHPDETLIVITADHETGGLSLDKSIDLAVLREAGARSRQVRHALGDDPQAITPEAVEHQVASVLGMNDLTDAEKAALGKASGADIKRRLDVVERAVRTMIQARAGVNWSTSGHSGQDVPVFAVGAGAERFEDVADNTDIPRRILQLVLPEVAAPVAPAAAVEAATP